MAPSPPAPLSRRGEGTKRNRPGLPGVARGLAVSRGRRGWVGSGQGRLEVRPLLLDEGADALAEQGDVERLLERLVEAVVRQRLGGRLVLAREGDDERLLVSR